MNAKLTPKVVALVEVIVIGVVVAVGWFLLVSPQKSKASDLDTQIAEVQTQVDLARLAARSNSRAEKTVEAKLRVLTVAMPDDVQMSSVLRELLAQARRSNVRLDSVRPQAASSAQNYLEIPMDVVVTGRYFAVEQYLKRLRREVTAVGDRVHAGGRLFDIQTVSFVEGEDNLPQIKATLHLEAFVFTPAAVSAAPATPTEPSTSGSASATGEAP